MYLKKQATAVILVLALCLSLLVGCNKQAAPQSTPLPPNDQIPVPNEDYIKSAHYFSDEWPINFWSCELDQLDSQLDAIVQDGFNSIVLVVPWREFQPDVESGKLSDYATDKLCQILEKANEKNLGVMYRVGYIWDYVGDEAPMGRFYQLLGDETYQAAWISYLQQLYSVSKQYPSFIGGFICWEDFWNFVQSALYSTEPEQSVDQATFVGYQKYLQDHYTLEEINNLYGTTFTDYSQIYLPNSGNPGLPLFYEFYDNWMYELLKTSQQYFPDLSMEVRLDADLVTDTQGQSSRYYHSATYPCGDASFASAMYSIPIGFPNKGERVSWQEALQQTDMVLSELLLPYSDGKSVYLEQFLYMDNTPGFEQNAQIKDGEVNTYLENVHTVLQEKSMGYGVWAYHDYANNMLYNPQFAMDFTGWETSGTAKVEKIDDSMCAHLSAGATLQQIIPSYRYSNMQQDTIYVRCEAWAEEPVNLTITVGGGEPQTIAVKPGDAEMWELSFPNNGNCDLSIQTDGDIYLDNFKVYTFIQKAELYDLDGNELSCLQGIRTLNSQLE